MATPGLREPGTPRPALISNRNVFKSNKTTNCSALTRRYGENVHNHLCVIIICRFNTLGYFARDYSCLLGNNNDLNMFHKEVPKTTRTHAVSRIDTPVPTFHRI